MSTKAPITLEESVREEKERLAEKQRVASLHAPVQEAFQEGLIENWGQNTPVDEMFDVTEVDTPLSVAV